MLRDKKAIIGRGLRDYPDGGLYDLIAIPPYGRVRTMRFVDYCTSLGAWSVTSGVTTVAGGIQLVGSGSWGGVGMISVASWAKVNGLAVIFECKVTSASPGAIVGFHDGSGNSYTDIANGIDFSASNLYGDQNGNITGSLSPYADATVYRIRTRIVFGLALYEIQGSGFASLGGEAWTSLGAQITSTSPLYLGVSIQSGTLLVSHVRVEMAHS